jgi:AraC-like DNA-binding protein
VSGVTIITADALRAHIKAGLTTAEIAAQFGVKTPAVTRACHRFGTGLPASGRATAKGKGQDPTREDDERLLEWLSMARRGCTVREISDAYGYESSASVQVAIKAVEVADLACGDPVREVARAYPKRRARG